MNTLMATTLTSDRPLWRLDLIDQQHPRRQFLILRVHHAVSDGLAGAGFGVLFADADQAKLREFERFLLTPRTCPTVSANIGDPVVAFTKSWITGMRMRRQLPPISNQGARVTAYGCQSLNDVRRTATASGASLAEHLLVATGHVIGQYSRRSRGRVRIGSAVSLDDAMRHTGNATSVITVDVDHPQSTSASINSVRKQIAHSREEHLHLAFVASQRKKSLLSWPIQRALTRATSRLFRTDAAVSINPVVLDIKSVFGSRVSSVYGLLSPVRFPLSVIYLISARQVSYGLVADPRALPAPIAHLTGALSRRLITTHDRMEVAPR